MGSIGQKRYSGISIVWQWRDKNTSIEPFHVPCATCNFYVFNQGQPKGNLRSTRSRGFDRTGQDGENQSKRIRETKDQKGEITIHPQGHFKSQAVQSLRLLTIVSGS